MVIPLTKLIKTANKSPHIKNKHATLVFRGGSLISFGYNHGTIHSEVNALAKIWPNKRVGTSIVNIMIKTRSGNFGNSRPCNKCMKILRQDGIIKITYSIGKTFVEERI